jgi:hypothetical protein
MPEIITRREARDRGLTKYLTGKPCKQGHVAERRTDSCNCIECERTPARKEYMRLYARRLRAAARFPSGLTPTRDGGVRV